MKKGDVNEMDVKTRLTLILLSALAVPAAAAEPLRIAPANTAPQGTIAAIEGPTWRLTNLRTLDPGLLPVGPRSVTARFHAGRINGFSGCNQFSGSYAFHEGRLSISSLSGSLMACDEASMTVESAVKSALAGELRPVLEHDRLVLKSGTGEPVISFSAEPIPTLEGLRSSITGFNNGRQAVVSPLLDTTLYVSFKGGVVRGFSGCNAFRATYVANGSSIAVGPVTPTRRTCVQAGIMQQEREFLSALKSATTWSFDGALLDMRRADGARTLVGTREIEQTKNLPGSGSSASTAAALRAKTIAADQSRIFVGSFNLDPRSARRNTEMGMVIDSPLLAGAHSKQLDGRLPNEAYAARSFLTNQML